MHFSGQLEDLNLQDLLRVLGFSCNSGLLQLRSGSDSAELLFDEGRVVSAWQQSKEPQRFRRMDVVSLVRELFSWETGEYSFLPGSPETVAEDFSGSLDACLDHGLRAEELLGEEEVRLPETREGAAVVECAGASVGTDASVAPARGPEVATILLADDDPAFAEPLLGAMAQQGLTARFYECGRDLLEAVQEAWSAQRRPLLIIDLIMPRLHGGGILGGLELLEQIHSLLGEQKCLMYSDYPCPEIAPRLQQLGVGELLNKPGRLSTSGTGDPDQVKMFCELLAEKASSLQANFTDVPTELASSVTSCSEPAEPSATTRVQGVGIGALSGMFQELRAAESSDQVMLLVLRFATEILNRAVLFSINDDRLVGVGQFGYGTAGGSADEKIRSLVVPLSEASLVKEVVDRGFAHVGPLGEGFWNGYLCRELDFDDEGEVFVGPLLRNGEAIALLCGDPLYGGAKAEDSQLLELFLQQTSMALDNLKMTEQLRSISVLLGKSFGC